MFGSRRSSCRASSTGGFLPDPEALKTALSDAQSDHASRVRRAACAIAAAVRADYRERRARGAAPVRLRIGIATGIVAAGNSGAPGRINFTVVGDAVSMAGRLEQLEKEVAPDEETFVLITDTSFRCIDGAFQTARTGAYTLRGRAGQTVVYSLLETASSDHTLGRACVSDAGHGGDANAK